jgi:hypothetical protein
MDNNHEPNEGTIAPDIEFEEELYGWSFHKWPFLIALGITALLLILVFAFVDPNPPYFDPSELPPPPAGG